MTFDELEKLERLIDAKLNLAFAEARPGHNRAADMGDYEREVKWALISLLDDETGDKNDQ